MWDTNTVLRFSNSRTPRYQSFGQNSEQLKMKHTKSDCLKSWSKRKTVPKLQRQCYQIWQLDIFESKHNSKSDPNVNKMIDSKCRLLKCSLTLSSNALTKGNRGQQIHAWKMRQTQLLTSHIILPSYKSVCLVFFFFLKIGGDFKHTCHPYTRAQWNLPELLPF